jgi:autotransporter-associated beta strand protein
MNKRLKNFAASLLAVLAVMAPNELYSATQTWVGGGTGNNWRIGSNWASLTIPAVGDDLIFAGSVRPNPNNNNSAVQGVFSSITFDSTATNFLITGVAALTFSNGITNNSVNTQTFNNPITLGSSNVTVAASSGNISLLQAVGDAGAGRGMTKTGSANLTLSTNNTYTGATTVSAGSLILSTNGSIASSSVLNVASGATLNVSAVSGGFIVGTNQTLRGSGSVVGNTTINGALQPGSSPGLLSFSNNLTLGSTAVTTMEINGAGNGAGSRGMVYDAISVDSLLTYDGKLSLTLGTTFAAGSYSFDLFDFGSQTGSFDSVTLGGNYTGSLVVNDVGLPTNWGLTSGDNTWTFDQSTGVLALSVIPEPSPLALSGLGLLALAVSALRKRRQP